MGSVSTTEGLSWLAGMITFRFRGPALAVVALSSAPGTQASCQAWPAKPPHPHPAQSQTMRGPLGRLPPLPQTCGNSSSVLSAHSSTVTARLGLLWGWGRASACLAMGCPLGTEQPFPPGVTDHEDTGSGCGLMRRRGGGWGGNWGYAEGKMVCGPQEAW